MNFVLRLGFFLILLIAIPLQAINRYPEWFLNAQKYPGIIVGYSYAGNPAQYDAENMYTAYRSCVVYGTLEIYQTSQDDQWLKNSDYYYYFSPDSVEKIRGRLVKVDSFQTELLSGDYIEAFMLDSADSNFSSPWVDVRTLSMPRWVSQTFWQDSAYYYGVGMYTSLGNENDAWKTAEEQAIFSILTNLAVGVFKLRLSDKESVEGSANMEEISFLTLRYLLQNIQVLQRFPDVENKVFYVLVRIPRNGLHSPLLGKSIGGN
jgi:hypothetical protein